MRLFEAQFKIFQILTRFRSKYVGKMVTPTFLIEGQGERNRVQPIMYVVGEVRRSPMKSPFNDSTSQKTSWCTAATAASHCFGLERDPGGSGLGSSEASGASGLIGFGVIHRQRTNELPFSSGAGNVLNGFVICLRRYVSSGVARIPLS